jgi:hypothetical protein
MFGSGMVEQLVALLHSKAISAPKKFQKALRFSVN